MVMYDCPMLIQAPQTAYSEESTSLSAVGTRGLAEPKQREGKVSSTEIFNLTPRELHQVRRECK
jgi:hypothetical protein